MAARITPEAASQIAALERAFFDKGRDRAIDLLAAALEAALDAADDPATRSRSFPGPYRDLSDLGLRWIKRHRYWFGFLHVAGEAFITNVLFDSSEILLRVVGRRATP